MGTREVYEEKLRTGNAYHHVPTINPGLGTPRCPRCLSLLDSESRSGEWTITPVLHDATTVAGCGIGGMLSATHVFNTGIPFVQKYVKGPKWLPFVVGLPPLLLSSAACAAFGGSHPTSPQHVWALTKPHWQCLIILFTKPLPKPNVGSNSINGIGYGKYDSLDLIWHDLVLRVSDYGCVTKVLVCVDPWLLAILWREVAGELFPVDSGTGIVTGNLSQCNWRSWEGNRVQCGLMNRRQTAGYALPKFTQLTVTSYYAASSASHYGISLLTRHIEEAHISTSQQEKL
uniref:Uncharacterized protein n=1 Tax=Chenopodium quinoa TaxID=63459 RepID=A0A803LFQ6_CHEQI